MLATPSSSPRPALVNRTNFFNRSNVSSLNPLPTPPEHGEVKRRSNGLEGGLKKRPKLGHIHEDLKQHIEDCGDLETTNARSRWRKSTTLYMFNAAAMTRPNMLRQTLSTRPILQSFVSSNKSDVFKCHSDDNNAFLSPPYACSYSNEAKKGSTTLLAVATEQGSVHILNTAKREGWDFERSRTILHPHSNGIFDIKWNRSDNLIATASGDQSVRITCLTTSKVVNVLRGHTHTVKSVAWDPNHHDLLSTGGRDGTVCVWDLRIGERKKIEDMNVMEAIPVLTIPSATGPDYKSAANKRKAKPRPNGSVTSLVYPCREPYRLISSGSVDGLLRSWDLRLPSVEKHKKNIVKVQPLEPISTSGFDPTTFNGSRRPRGLTTITLGTGITTDFLFALGADSRVYTYTAHDLMPQTRHFANEKMQGNSFYVRLAASPCGRWLATGSASTGSAFLYDVSNTSRPSKMTPSYASAAVELRGQSGEVGALDWAEGMLATCADDGSVRVWRPDVDVYNRCKADPEEAKWEWCWSVA